MNIPNPKGSYPVALKHGRAWAKGVALPFRLAPRRDVASKPPARANALLRALSCSHMTIEAHWHNRTALRAPDLLTGRFCPRRTQGRREAYRRALRVRPCPWASQGGRFREFARGTPGQPCHAPLATNSRALLPP